MRVLLHAERPDNPKPHPYFVHTLCGIMVDAEVVVKDLKQVNCLRCKRILRAKNG